MKRTLIGICIVALLIIMIGFSYAYFLSIKSRENSDGVVEIGTLSLVYKDGNELKLDSTISDNYIKKVFTVTNNGSLAADYSINLVDLINVTGRESFVFEATCESYDSQTKNSEDYCMNIDEVVISTSNDSTTSIIKEGISIKPGITHEYTVTISFIQRSGIQDNGFSSKISVTQSDESNLLVSKMLRHNNVISDENVDFSVTSEVSKDKGLYYTSDVNYTEDGKEVVYYRGAVENNYVIFGEYASDKKVYYSKATMKEYASERACKKEADDCEIYTYYKTGDKMCWRIVRTNEDGSVKLRYAGATANGKCQRTGSDVKIGLSSFNNKYNDNAYLGYMYGEVGLTIEDEDGYDKTHVNKNNSIVKSVLDNWYKETIANTSYHSLVANTVYCNDRSTVASVSMPTIELATGIIYMNTGLGYGKNITFYRSTKSFYNSISNNANGYLVANDDHRPTYVCAQNNDKFTLSVEAGGNIEYGNNALIYPVGLLTLDEAVFAGGNVYKNNNVSTNSSYYLYTSNWYWLMTPSYFNGTHAEVFRANVGSEFGSGSHYSTISVNTTAGGVVPVISLKSNALVSRGIGTYDDPYIVSAGAI